MTREVFITQVEREQDALRGFLLTLCCGADERTGIVECRHRATACLMVEECIVGYLEEPRAESSFVLIARRREVSLDQRILRQVIGIALVATAEGEQEATKGLLLTLYLSDENFAGHLFSACDTNNFSSASISLASIFLPTK